MCDMQDSNAGIQKVFGNGSLSPHRLGSREAVLAMQQTSRNRQGRSRATFKCGTVFDMPAGRDSTRRSKIWITRKSGVEEAAKISQEVSEESDCSSFYSAKSKGVAE